MALKLYPNDYLDSKTLDIVHFDNDELLSILLEMRSTLLEKNALGLAANQMGYNYAIFLMKDKRGEVFEFINPIIIESKGTQCLEEGCLSFPDIYVKVNRASEIHIKAQDRKGEWFEKIAVDLEAVILQHEYDHLMGKTFLDRVNRHERRKILKKFK